VSWLSELTVKLAASVPLKLTLLGLKLESVGAGGLRSPMGYQGAV